MFGVDVALLQVKITEGALYPTVTAQASVQQNWEVSPTILQQFNASRARPGHRPDLSGRRGILDDPPVQGDARPAPHRSRDARAIRRSATVVQAWGQLEAAKAQIDATQAQVTAAEIALNGVREEARVGQRTTLDVLNAQQELVNARVALVTAQRDRVVASYTLLPAVGRLSPQVLGLKVPVYDPMRALPAGARQLGRRAHARRPLSARSRVGRVSTRGCCPHATWLAFDLPYCHTSANPAHIARVRG